MSEATAPSALGTGTGPGPGSMLPTKARAQSIPAATTVVANTGDNRASNPNQPQTDHGTNNGQSMAINPVEEHVLVGETSSSSPPLPAYIKNAPDTLNLYDWLASLNLDDPEIVEIVSTPQASSAKATTKQHSNATIWQMTCSYIRHLPVNTHKDWLPTEAQKVTERDIKEWKDKKSRKLMNLMMGIHPNHPDARKMKQYITGEFRKVIYAHAEGISLTEGLLKDYSFEARTRMIRKSTAYFLPKTGWKPDQNECILRAICEDAQSNKRKSISTKTAATLVQEEREQEKHQSTLADANKSTLDKLAESRKRTILNNTTKKDRSKVEARLSRTKDLQHSLKRKTPEEEDTIPANKRVKPGKPFANLRTESGGKVRLFRCDDVAQLVNQLWLQDFEVDPDSQYLFIWQQLDIDNRYLIAKTESADTIKSMFDRLFNNATGTPWDIKVVDDEDGILESFDAGKIDEFIDNAGEQINIQDEDGDVPMGGLLTAAGESGSTGIEYSGGDGDTGSEHSQSTVTGDSLENAISANFPDLQKTDMDLSVLDPHLRLDPPIATSQVVPVSPSPKHVKDLTPQIHHTENISKGKECGALDPIADLDAARVAAADSEPPNSPLMADDYALPESQDTIPPTSPLSEPDYDLLPDPEPEPVPEPVPEPIPEPVTLARKTRSKADLELDILARINASSQLNASLPTPEQEPDTESNATETEPKKRRGRPKGSKNKAKPPKGKSR